MKTEEKCQICGSGATILDVVDFNKSCEELRGVHLPLSGVPIYYFLCPQCGFCFAPEMQRWPMEEFESKVYNDEYIKVDPCCVEIRPQGDARSLLEKFPQFAPEIRHLDYGGGTGVLSQVLKDNGWNSATYDPFHNKNTDLNSLGKFHFITAYEVFEHVPDVNQLMQTLTSLLEPDGLVFFSTSVSDGHIKNNERINWWYASPRNGHISVFSNQSLKHLVTKYDFQFISDWVGHHAFFRTLPEWAKPLLG
jgi:SAM-dependent methyltransferase